MPTTVERVVRVPASPEAVWEFVADPATRARSISVVSTYDIVDETRSVWQVDNPLLPGDTTLAVEIDERVRDAPSRVEYDGRSRAFDITGAHELEGVDDGCRLTSTFDIDQHIPGVEEYFEDQLDTELDNIERAIVAAVAEPGG